MGKVLKRMLATMLSLTFVVSAIGCSNSTTAKNEKGRYVEERYELPSNTYIQSMVKLDDGKIAIIAYNEEGKLTSFISEDGGKTLTESTIELPKEEGKETAVMSSTYLSDGRIILSYYFMEPFNEDSVTLDGTITEGEVAEGDSETTDDNIKEEWVYEEPEYKYAIIENDGTITDIDLGNNTENEHEMMYGGPQQLASAANGDIFYSNGMGEVITQIDGETFEEKNIFSSDDYINSFLLVGDSLIICGFDSIIEFDINTGKEIGNLEELEKETIKSQTSYYPSFINSGSKDKLYYYNVNGLFAYDMESKKVSQLIDGALSSFGMTDMYLMAFIEKENDEFLAAFNDWTNNEVTLINYKYDAEIASVPDQQIRVYSLLENDAIRQAISAYAKAHPDIYIKYEIGLSWDNGVTESDALKTLNTEIMAGNGPDIILLDGLEAESYIEKGLLEDLSDVISPMVDNDEIFKNIADAYTVDEKIYQFPTSFRFPMLVGNKDTINSVADFKSLVELTKKLASESDNRVFSDYYSPKGLLYALYYLYGNNWLNSDKTINVDEISNFFTLTKEMYDAIDANYQKYIESMNDKYQMDTNKDSNFSVDSEEGIADKNEVDENYEDVSNVYELQYYLSPSIYADSFLMDEPVSLMYGSLDGTYGYSSLITALLNDTKLDYKVLSRGDEKIFIPSNVIGINAKSENKDAAKEILKEMLSEKSKDNMMYSQGLTVNKKSLKNQFELEKSEYYEPEFDETTNHYTQGSMIFIDENGKEKEIKQLWPNEEDVNKLIGEIESLQVAPVMNRVLLVEVAKQFNEFATGNITLDDAMNTIVDNLDLYLSE